MVRFFLAHKQISDVAKAQHHQSLTFILEINECVCVCVCVRTHLDPEGISANLAG